MASATARQRTGRIRFPRLERVAHRLFESPSSAKDERARYASKASRSSSAGRIGQAACARELGLDLARKLGELADQVDRRIPVDVVGRRQALGSSRFAFSVPRSSSARASASSTGVYAASSRAMRASTPFTSRAASSDAYRFASTTASLIATSRGTVSSSSSHTMRRILRSSVPEAVGFGQSGRRRDARRQVSARPATASASERANSSGSPRTATRALAR